MKVIRCKNGHYFDGDSYSTCPHCGEDPVVCGNIAPVKEEKKNFWGHGRKDKETDTLVNKTSSINSTNGFGNGNTPTDVISRNTSGSISSSPLKKNPTLDFWQTSSHSESKASESGTETKGKDKLHGVQDEEDVDEKIKNTAESDMQPEAKENEQQTEDTTPHEISTSLREAVKNASASNEGKTMSYFSSATASSPVQAQHRYSSEPVVGWLVCIGGFHFGECFNIYAGKNSIGRSEENRIAIIDDNSISRIKHAFIVYEPKKRNFYLHPGDSSGLTYLNDDYITDSHMLTPYDTIELGDSRFRFIPLCGESFSWEDYMPKGE